jgi:hypothetical protein
MSRRSSTLARHTLAACDEQPTRTAGRQKRLKVWSWWQRDLLSLKEVACVIAAHTRSDVNEARRRLELAGHATLDIERPANPGFATAMEQPFRLIWMTLDDYVSRSTHWLGEEQLHALRVAARSEAS